MFGSQGTKFHSYYDQFEELERVNEELMKKFPRFKLVDKKNSLFMKAIDIFLKLITFGHMKTFMINYTTTVGFTVYTPSTWISRSHLSRAETLRHEGVHMAQLTRLGFFTYVFLYLFFILPGGLALGRMLLESEAYEESLRAVADYYGVEKLREKSIRKSIVDHFVGPEYFWMWPFRENVERWYDDFVSELERIYLGN